MKTSDEFLEELKADMHSKAVLFKETRDSGYVQYFELWDCRIRLCNYVINEIEKFQAEQKQVKDDQL